MDFIDVPVTEADGTYLAHACRLDDGRIAKGTRIDAGMIARLCAAGVERLTVARLGVDDVHEDEAALALARAMSGNGLRTGTAKTGRVNLFATTHGLLLIERAAIEALNGIDERITCATLTENRQVRPGHLVATVKIIPYALPGALLQRALACLAPNRAPIVLAPVRSLSLALVQSRQPGTREEILDKTFHVTRQRMAQRDALLLLERRCAHRVDALRGALEEALAHEPGAIMIVGASAISDRADVVPRAIEAAGGKVSRFGIPVDPGNLLLLGRIGDTAIIGAPGCARSPRDNGLDRVLDRLVCGQAIDDAWLNSLAIGGLLEDDVDRPAPRREAAPARATGSAPRIGALVLAAGGRQSTPPARNPALLEHNGMPCVASVVTRLVTSKLERIVVVTGYQAAAVTQALSPIAANVEIVDNTDWQGGLGRSIAVGIDRLLDCDAVLVCFGTTPAPAGATIDALIDACLQARGERLWVPTYRQRRGHPVLISAVFFDALRALRGDAGARYLQDCYPESVYYVDTDDANVVHGLHGHKDSDGESDGQEG